MSRFIVQSNTGGYVAEVDANNNLQVNPPTTLAEAGYVALGGLVTDGLAYVLNAPRQVRRIEVSDSYRVRVGLDSPMLREFFPGVTIHDGVWKQGTTTFSITTAGGMMNLNAAASIAVSGNATVNTWRTFPIYSDMSLKFETSMLFAVTSLTTAITQSVPATGFTAEWGLFYATFSAVTAPTDGVFFRMAYGFNQLLAVVSYNGTETCLPLGIAPTQINVRASYAIVVNNNRALFYMNNELVGTIQVPTTGYSSATLTASNELPAAFRLYSGVQTPVQAITMKIGYCLVTLIDGGAQRPWTHALSGMGYNLAQFTPGNGYTIAAPFTANSVNVTGPASATLSNTTAGYAATLLGGQWQYAAVATSETNNDVFAYLNLAGAQVVAANTSTPARTMYITGIRFDMCITTSANLTQPNCIQFGLAVGSTAVSAAAANDSAVVKGPRRYALGYGYVWTTDAAGQNNRAPALDVKFESPLVVNQGEYVQVLMKNVSAAATASEIMRGIVTINGYWE